MIDWSTILVVAALIVVVVVRVVRWSIVPGGVHRVRLSVHHLLVVVICLWIVITSSAKVERVFPLTVVVIIARLLGVLLQVRVILIILPIIIVIIVALVIVTLIVLVVVVLISSIVIVTILVKLIEVILLLRGGSLLTWVLVHGVTLLRG